jgi:hypothetical protein
MKKILLLSALIFVLLSTFANAQHDHDADKPAVHGMLIFGKEKIYASHLPLFRSPHNYQIILELELDKTSKQKFVADQKQNLDVATYSLEPEKFVLPEMLVNPKPFKINVYRGHFERGGTQILKGITVTVKQVIFNEKFAPEKVRLTVNNFILFGSVNEKFIAHQITAKPDFEQIIQVKSAFVFGTEKYALIKVNNAENSPLGVSGNEMEVFHKNTKLTVGLLKQIYLEFNDLKN